MTNVDQTLTSLLVNETFMPLLLMLTATEYEISKAHKNKEISYFKTLRCCIYPAYTIKPVLRGRSKRRQKQVFKTNYRLLQVKNIAECSKGSILQNAPRGAFCNTFDLH